MTSARPCAFLHNFQVSQILIFDSDHSLFVVNAAEGNQQKSSHCTYLLIKSAFCLCKIVLSLLKQIRDVRNNGTWVKGYIWPCWANGWTIHWNCTTSWIDAYIIIAYNYLNIKIPTRDGQHLGRSRNDTLFIRLCEHLLLLQMANKLKLTLEKTPGLGSQIDIVLAIVWIRLFF